MYETTYVNDNQLKRFLKTAVNSLNKHIANTQIQQLVEIASKNIDIADIYTSDQAATLQTPLIFLAMSSHSTCMAAYVTALIGHPSATTSINRTGLEAALFAYGISHDSELLEKWRNPPMDRRNRINASACLRRLKNDHPGQFDEVDNLYKDLISTGGHPTKSSLLRSSNADQHLFEDGHVYTTPPEFTVDVILNPCTKTITQLIIAIATHAYSLHISALADHKHPKSAEIIAKSIEVQKQILNFLRVNQSKSASC